MDQSKKKLLVLPSHVKPFLESIISVCHVLASKKFPGVLIGGIASSILGKPRFTSDIDAVILNADEQLTEVLEMFAKENILSRIDNVIGFATY